MDHVVASAHRYFESQEAEAEAACIECAQEHGFSAQQAEKCEQGQELCGVVDCPFLPKRKAQVLVKIEVESEDIPEGDLKNRILALFRTDEELMVEKIEGWDIEAKINFYNCEIMELPRR